MGTGIDAAFMTEDVIKTLLKENGGAQELITGIVKNAKSTRDDILNSIKAEVFNYLKKIDLQSEIEKILDNYDLDVEAKIKFSQKIKKKNVRKKSARSSKKS